HTRLPFVAQKVDVCTASTLIQRRYKIIEPCQMGWSFFGTLIDRADGSHITTATMGERGCIDRNTRHRAAKHSKLRYCKRTGTLKMFDNRFRHVSVKGIEEECAGDFLRWTTFRLHQLVYFRVRHGLNHIDQRRERSEGGEYLLAIADSACVCHQCHDDQLAMMFFRQEGHRRTDHDVGNCRKLIWGGFRLRNEFGDHIGRRRKNQHSADNLIDLMQPEFEAGDDAEVATATANRPEEI